MEDGDVFQPGPEFCPGKLFVIILLLIFMLEVRILKNSGGIMKFSAVSISTRDIDQSVAFYQNIIGLELYAMSSPFPGQKIAVLKDGEGNSIELVHNENTKPFAGEGIKLSFVVDQIGTAEELMKENSVPVIAMPKTLKNGVKAMIVQDPNGLELTLVEE